MYYAYLDGNGNSNPDHLGVYFCRTCRRDFSRSFLSQPWFGQPSCKKRLPSVFDLGCGKSQLGALTQHMSKQPVLAAGLPCVACKLHTCGGHVCAYLFWHLATNQKLSFKGTWARCIQGTTPATPESSCPTLRPPGGLCMV